MDIKLVKLKTEDKDIEKLVIIHRKPSIAKYIFIADNYFDYVTTTEKVTYYKIICDGQLVGGLHIEDDNGTMYLSICIDENYRRKSIATTAIKYLFSQLTTDTNLIEASIDNDNHASLQLFNKLGFKQIRLEDKLIILQKDLKGAR